MTGKKRISRRRVFMALGLAAVILALIFFGYVGDYYRADSGALEALDSAGTVRVQREENGYFFDGPGSGAALVFYPGAKVEAAAYAPLMSELAGAGLDCFLVEMPFHLAFFGLNRAGEIQPGRNYDRWYLGGHSLGGAMAASYASEHLEEWDGLLLLAAYPVKSLEHDGFSVLSIYGSEDGVLNRDKLDQGRIYMPEDYTELCLEGGNHAGFGAYGAQKGDGTASLSPTEQWTQTARAVARAWL